MAEFAASERGAEPAALMYTLIQTAKLNNADPQVWLADVLSPSPTRLRLGSQNSPLDVAPRTLVQQTRLTAKHLGRRVTFRPSQRPANGRH
jgi:hypothetical protein